MSRATTITGPLAALVAHAGGVAALAVELGVSVSTLSRWGTGRVTPAPIVREAVGEWARRRGLASPWPPPPFDRITHYRRNAAGVVVERTQVRDGAAPEPSREQADLIGRNFDRRFPDIERLARKAPQAGFEGWQAEFESLMQREHTDDEWAVFLGRLVASSLHRAR